MCNVCWADATIQATSKGAYTIAAWENVSFHVFMQAKGEPEGPAEIRLAIESSDDSGPVWSNWIAVADTAGIVGVLGLDVKPQFIPHRVVDALQRHDLAQILNIVEEASARHFRWEEGYVAGKAAVKNRRTLSTFAQAVSALLISSLASAENGQSDLLYPEFVSGVAAGLASKYPKRLKRRKRATRVKAGT